MGPSFDTHPFSLIVFINWVSIVINLTLFHVYHNHHYQEPYCETKIDLYILALYNHQNRIANIYFFFSPASHEGPVWQVSWAHPKYGSILASCSYDRKVMKKNN